MRAMSLGYDRELNVVNKSDTAKLVVMLYDEDTDQPMSADDLLSVSFVVAAPDNTRTSAQGIIQEDGSGLLMFNGTTQVGEYTAVGTFTLEDGSKRSARADFEVIDPFKTETPSVSFVIANAAWAKLEDCFDAEDEGPWLRDMTLNFFNKNKMESFIAEGLFFINEANPPTALDQSYFAQIDPNGIPIVTPEFPLIAQATFIQVLRHLIRSYVEQPQPTGAQIAWQDRRDYLLRWQAVLQIEQQAFDRMLALFKRKFLMLGHSKIMVSSKAGRLIPAPMRTRMVGRGYW